MLGIEHNDTIFNYLDFSIEESDVDHGFGIDKFMLGKLLAIQSQ
jgi:hypothetical protein